MTTCPEAALRPLGAFERTIDLYMHRNPVQFSMVAQLDRTVSPAALASALTEIQRRHPLLGAMVDRTAEPAVFRATDAVVGLEVAADGTPWQAVVVGDQTRPIPPTPGPLLRATLVPRGTGTDVVLTFAHQVTDGVGGLSALLDLVAALDGGSLLPGVVPAALEDLLATTVDPTGTPPPDLAPVDDRMSAVGEVSTFSHRPPHLDALALDPGLTARLVHRAREEGASVHAALCAAAATVLHRRGRDFVRVLSPVDLRRVLGLSDDEVVVRFAGARTGSETADTEDFWTLARGVHASLAAQRSPAALRAGAAALAGNPPSEPAQAEAMMAAATAADIQITNLGVARPRSDGALSAVWGPAQTTQLRGEHVLGVVTARGRLRLTELTHDPVAGLLPELGALVAEACAEPHGG
ncbi:peptide synthetase [Pseudonocardia sp. ICBG1122]|nr:peptide synthetase [Pseudonocardia pini]